MRYRKLLYDLDTNKVTLSNPRKGREDTLEDIHGIEYKGSAEIVTEVTASHALFSFEGTAFCELKEGDGTRTLHIHGR